MMGSEWQVPALIPKAELEGEMGDSQMGHCKHISRAKLYTSLLTLLTQLRQFSSFSVPGNYILV
jgi:RecA/RadA recombinase